MTSISVSLTDTDWDERLGGWRCAALRIPGAQPDGLFSNGTKWDDACYRVDPSNQIVRFPGPDRPQEAALSLSLTEELSTADLTHRWKKLAVVMPLVTVVAGALIGRIALPPPSSDECGSTTSSGSTPSCYETWRITGRFKGDAKVMRSLTSDVSPPKIAVKRDGSFDEQIPVLNDGHGNRVFPSIVFDSNIKGYGPTVLHFDPKYPGGDGVLIGKRTVDFGRGLEFKKVTP